MSTQQYSIAFIPNDTIIAYVKALKLQLGETIGWFSSKNAMAHITIGEMQVSHEALQHIHTIIEHISNDIRPFEIILEHLQTFENSGTLYLSIDAVAKDKLEEIMQIFHQRFTLQGSDKNPHMTIGRKLTPEQLAKGMDILHVSPKTFLLDSVSLRKFDPEVKQYEVIHTYSFTK
ncbi:2'-5' RNA ligase [Pustulibacterium marinum]|uniref:2'-5' RNA ligase n=1 Tax=Pustulibacterium marinum TaxID=1224947 RepID=A0A1I7H0G2_9FLAO|nr:2'-5' RNA ligase family protein [Pustulibacterium marinum]SFU54198.1 2'-5' RNA ligase [Pustulibacterium marinum]